MGFRDQGARAKKGGPPGPDDFTPKAIYRRVLTDTLQHPLTLLPAVGSALGGLYMGLFGADPTTFALTFGGAVASVGAWVFNYYIRGEALAQRRVARLRRLREQRRHEELASLETEWAAAGLEEGAKQARELREVYLKLDGFLKERFSGLGGQRLAVLAEDTYREGVTILREALVTYRALQEVNYEQLWSEVGEWRDKLKVVADKTQAEALEARIAAHERRLRLFKERLDSVEKLLAQSEELESALESTYLEAVDLKSPEAFFARGRSVSALERAVAAARRVEDKLRGIESPDRDDDQYLEAGDRPG